MAEVQVAISWISIRSASDCGSMQPLPSTLPQGTFLTQSVPLVKSFLWFRKVLLCCGSGHFLVALVFFEEGLSCSVHSEVLGLQLELAAPHRFLSLLICILTRLLGPLLGLTLCSAGEIVLQCFTSVFEMPVLDMSLLAFRSTIFLPLVGTN